MIIFYLYFINIALWTI